MKLPKNTRIELAPHGALDALGDFPDELIRRIFDIKGALMTDQSSLWDFLDCFTADVPEEKLAVLAQIRQEYGVDVSDITDGNIVLVCRALIGRAPKTELTGYDKCHDGPFHPFRDHKTPFGWGVRHRESGTLFALIGDKGCAFAFAALLNGHIDAAQEFVVKDFTTEYFMQNRLSQQCEAVRDTVLKATRATNVADSNGDG